VRRKVSRGPARIRSLRLTTGKGEVLHKERHLNHLRYEIPSFLSIPEKVELATKALVVLNNVPTAPTLAISFFSAASFPLALPTTVARGFGWPQAGFGVEGVNSRFGSWLINALSGGTIGEKGVTASGPNVKGWTLMDFFEDPEDRAVIPLLIECNFRGT